MRYGLRAANKNDIANRNRHATEGLRRHPLNLSTSHVDPGEREFLRNCDVCWRSPR